jgi:CxxC motif-containing protein (DUF1111 family)
MYHRLLLSASVAFLLPTVSNAQAPKPKPPQPPAQPPAQPPLPPPRPGGPAGPNAGPRPNAGNGDSAAPVPLSGLDPTLLAAFEAGRAEFEKSETPANGLGPIFNESSCVACHRGPSVGGSSPRAVTRFARIMNGRFDPMLDNGGPLLQDRSIHRAIQEKIPVEATLQARRQTTPLFGLGLVEAIPDETLIQLANRPPEEGVRGRAAMILDPDSGQTRVGKFGWKSQHSSLSSFSADAYLNEMGITNRLFPAENAPNGNVLLLKQADTLLDPEDATVAPNKADFELATDFMRLLAPLPTRPLSPVASTGKRLFESVGCASCHVPVLRTGAHPVPALANQPVALYSDLLLHDMGKLGDGMVQGAATGTEMRTAPLWGSAPVPPIFTTAGQPQWKLQSWLTKVRAPSRGTGTAH